MCRSFDMMRYRTEFWVLSPGSPGVERRKTEEETKLGDTVLYKGSVSAQHLRAG